MIQLHFATYDKRHLSLDFFFIGQFVDRVIPGDVLLITQERVYSGSEIPKPNPKSRLQDERAKSVERSV